MRIKYHSVWTTRHWRKNPRTGLYEKIWEDVAIDRNILHDTGEIAILSAFFATGMANYGATQANLYLGLDTRANLAEADTLATLTELTKSGYARKACATNGTGAAGQDFYINQPAAYYRADSKVVQWTAGENWLTAVKNVFLCTDLSAVVDGNGDHLVSSLVLSAERLLLNGDKLDSSVYVGMSE